MLLMKSKRDTEISVGELTDYPNDQYRKFFDKFNEINSVDVKDWKTTHVLSYFCQKYQNHYQSKYKFKFNSPAPSKCFEVFQVKKLASMLSSKPEMLKNYIDWVFENKVLKAKRKLTSISFLTSEGLVKEYKFNILLNQNDNCSIQRSTPLPGNYAEAFSRIGYVITTYGELAFLSQMHEMPFELIGAFQQIESLGFDNQILSKIV